MRRSRFMKSLSVMLMLSLLIGTSILQPIIAQIGASPIVIDSGGAVPLGISYIPMWDIRDYVYPYTFSAKFVGGAPGGIEEHVFVFPEARGDIIEFGNEWYLSVLDTNVLSYSVSVYRVRDGAQVYTGDLNGTFLVRYNNGFVFYRVWDRYGFFDPTGRYMVEDPAFYGTLARVVDVRNPYVVQYKPDEATIPIDWGFSELEKNAFSYAQFAQDGKLLVVGYPKKGSLLVFVYNESQNKYVLGQEISPSKFGAATPGYAGQFYVTWNGKYIVVGYADKPILEVWKFSYDNIEYYVKKGVVSYSCVGIYNLSLMAGVSVSAGVGWNMYSDNTGAIIASDMEYLGYIVVATTDGRCTVLYFAPSTDSLSLIRSREIVDSLGRVSSVITRGGVDGKSVLAVALLDSGLNIAKIFVHDIYTGVSYVFVYGARNSTAVAVSRDSGYIFGAGGLWKMERPTVKAGSPRLRLEGHMWFNVTDFYLKDGSLYVPPSPGNVNWTASIASGDVVVTRARIIPDPVIIVTDETVRDAKFGEFLYKGLLRVGSLVEVGGEIEGYGIVPNDDETVKQILSKYNVDPSKIAVSYANMKVTSLYGWNGSGFGGATLSYATSFILPFEKPVEVGLYDSIIISSDFAVTTIAPVFDWKNEVLGLFGIQFATGYATAQAGVMTYLLGDVISQYVLMQFGLGAAAPGVATALEKAAMVVPKALGKVLAVVGAAIIVDDVLGIWFKEEVFSSVRSLAMVVPVIEAPDGKHYGVVVMILPEDEITNNKGEYLSHLEAIREHIGLDGIEVVFKPFGKDWDEFKALLEDGHLPDINLKEAIIDTLVERYGYDINDLKIIATRILIETLAHGKVNFWQYVTGGLRFVVATGIVGTKVNIVGTPSERVFTDPNEILKLVDSITVNYGGSTLTVPLVVSKNGVRASFEPSLGVSVEDFSIAFNKKVLFHLALDFSLKVNVFIDQVMEQVGGYMYKSYFVFTWRGAEYTPQLHLDAIGFVDMPYPLTKAVRVAIYAYGEHVDDFTEYLELYSVVQDPSSPSGYRYTYMTSKNTQFIDPRNGGLLQFGETFMFKYFYGEPPDVSVEVLFNGTSVVSTLVRHVMVGVHSSVIGQEVTVRTSIEVYRKEDGSVTLIDSRGYTETVYVPEDTVVWLTYDIADLVDLAITTMRSENKVTYVQVTAKVIGCEENDDPTNDVVSAVYYPPPSLSYGSEEYHTVTVYAYDAITGNGVSGVTVTLSTSEGSWSGVTNASGYATITVPYVMYYNVTISDTVYNAPPMHVYVYKNGTILLPLVQAEITVIPPANGSYSPITVGGTDYYWLSIYVSNADGFPLDGAHVVIYDETTSTTLFDFNTGLSGYIHVLIPSGKTVRYTIDAMNSTDPSLTYHDERTVTMTQHYFFAHTVSWSSSYYTPEVYILNASFEISRGQGYYDEPVYHLIELEIWTNYPQTITIRLDLYNVDDPNNPAYVSSNEAEVALSLGLNRVYTWISVFAPNGGYFQVAVSIVSYEADTDTTNNYAWTNVQYLKPYVDYVVGIEYKIIHKKLDWATLPGDEIQVSVRIASMNKNVSLPLSLKVTIKERRWGNVLETIKDWTEVVNAYGEVVYKNFTITVPWTDRLYIEVSATHPWDDKPWNNYGNVTIDIFPDAEISVEVPPFVVEGQKFTIKVHIKSNVMEPGYTIGIAVRDNTTNQLLGFQEVELRPDITIEINYTMPNNPEMLYGIRYPVVARTLTASISGDIYEGNNWATIEVKTYSTQFTFAILVIVALFIFTAFTRAFRDVVEDMKVFVKKKGHGRFKGTIETERGFVRRKR